MQRSNKATRCKSPVQCLRRGGRGHSLVSGATSMRAVLHRVVQRTRVVRVVIVVLFASTVIPAQQTPSSWDAPGNSSAVELQAGFPCLQGEIVIGLNDWSDYPALAATVDGRGDAILGAIPRLRAVRIRI